MKKIILLIILIFQIFTSYAQQEPLIKFYQSDGNIKEFIISEIESISFTEQSDSVQTKIFTNGNHFYYPTKVIDSILFTDEGVNQLNMVLMIGGSVRNFLLNELDSIQLYYTKYNSITIGTQIWMLKNLDVDHYRNGEPIPEVIIQAQWTNLTTGAWCYYENYPGYGLELGKLYNWYAVNDPRGLAPDGWHVPSDEEWATLRDYLGGESVAGGKMKEAGTSHWQHPNSATNESGFTGLPGNTRSDIGVWSEIGVAGIWWSTTEVDVLKAWDWGVLSYDRRFRRGNYNKSYGLSVRCVKD